MDRHPLSVSVRKSIAVLAAALVAMVAFARPAHAENFDPSALSGILEILESAVLDRLLPDGTSVGLGGCQVEVHAGFPTTELRFHHVGTCKLEGTVALGILPLIANVRLTVYDTPVIQEIDADFVMQLRLLKPRSVRWQLTNGQVVLRLTPASPVTTKALTGAGSRVRDASGQLTVNRRFNVFDPASGSGMALVRTVENGTRSRQKCFLAGATLADPASGTLSGCTAF